MRKSTKPSRTTVVPLEQHGSPSDPSVVKTKPKSLEQSVEDFLTYLDTTIIPDSEANGFEGYARDLKQAAKIIRFLRDDAAIARQLRKTLKAQLNSVGGSYGTLGEFYSVLGI